MEWIREEIEKRQRIDEEISLINQFADTAFKALWSAVLEVVNDLDVIGLGLNLIPNGCEGHRDVRKGGERLEVILIDKRTIHATCSPIIDFRFELKAKKDGSQNLVYLDWKGKEIEPAKAAQMIMKPFLFGVIPD